MKKIVLTGAESTGKSTLAKILSDKLQVPLVKEYSRTYLTNLNRPYGFDDLTIMAQHQLEAERIASLHHASCIICDTGLLVLKIWSEYKYGKLDTYIAEQWAGYKCDLFILPHFDIPYESGPLRENPEERHILFQLYQDALEQYAIPYLIVKGSIQERSEQALKAVKALILSDT